MSHKLRLGIALFVLGFIGVLSLLTLEVSMDGLPPEVAEQISPEVFRYLVLSNPTLLLILSVVAGTLLFDKVKLEVPNISKLVGRQPKSDISFVEQIKYGVALGLITGFLLVGIEALFSLVIPGELAKMSAGIKLGPLARFLYGGITEEILLRYGFMTLVVWVVFKITKHLGSGTYWTGIGVAAVIFAVLHFPVVFGTVPEPSFLLLSYVLVGNSVGGVFFGWLYWRKGLEAAMIAHIFAHVAMLTAMAIGGN